MSRRFTAWSLALVVLLLGAALAQAQVASAAEAPKCVTTNILAFRGSGATRENVRDNGDSFTTFKTDGWEGVILHRALRAYENEAGAHGVDLSGVKVTDVGPDIGGGYGYRAISFGTAGLEGITGVAGNPYLIAPTTGMATIVDSTLAAVLTSSREGAKAGVYEISRAIRGRAPGCDVPKFATIGHSQGAMAGRDLYMMLSQAKRISTVMGFGDPFQIGRPTKADQDSAGLYGSGAGGSGMYILHELKYGTTGDKPLNKEGLSDFYRSDEVRRYTLCHTGDPFCDYQWLTGVFFEDPHNDYAKDEQEAIDIGSWMVDHVTDSLDEPGLQPVTAPSNPWTLRADLTPWMPGQEVRLNIIGPPDGATLNVTLTPTKSTAKAPHPQLTTPTVVTALQQQHVGAKSAFLPDYIASNYGIDLPRDLAGGQYDLTITTSKATLKSSIYVTWMPDVGDDRMGELGDWEYNSEVGWKASGETESGCTSKWPCEHDAGHAGY